VLVHELAHVHGAEYGRFGRAGAEVIAETAAFVALSAARLDTSRQAVPYVAGWSEATPRQLAEYAEAVHRIAAILEDGLGLELTIRARESPLERTAEERVRSAREAAREATGPAGPQPRGTALQRAVVR
jgi:hypothetical protein